MSQPKKLPDGDYTIHIYDEKLGLDHDLEVTISTDWDGESYLVYDSSHLTDIVSPTYEDQAEDIISDHVYAEIRDLHFELNS